MKEKTKCARTKKARKNKVKSKKKRVQFELVSPFNFYDAMYESMASEAWELDHRRKPSDYIR
jgi:hypothetical protein